MIFCFLDLHFAFHHLIERLTTCKLTAIKLLTPKIHLPSEGTLTSNRFKRPPLELNWIVNNNRLIKITETMIEVPSQLRGLSPQRLPFATSRLQLILKFLFKSRVKPYDSRHLLSFQSNHDTICLTLEHLRALKRLRVLNKPCYCLVA